ncbi:MAG TPA: DUF11 domain-containing protein, partial [Thermoanaerobaculia bacterium]
MSTVRPFLALALFVAALAAPRALSQEADLLATKTGPAEAAAGADVSYDVTVTNLGPDEAATISIDDVIPAGMTFVSLTQTGGPTASCSTPAPGSDGAINCTLATLAAGQTVELTLVFNIDETTPPETTFTNIVTATTATFDPNEENNTGIATTSTPPPAQGDM